MRRLFSLLALLLLAATVYAQTDRVATGPFVQYTIDAVFREEDETPYDHPLVLRLAAQTGLDGMEVMHEFNGSPEAAQSHMTVHVRLRFDDMETFKMWYEDEETESLMRALREASNLSIRTKLALRHPPR